MRRPLLALLLVFLAGCGDGGSEAPAPAPRDQARREAPSSVPEPPPLPPAEPREIEAATEAAAALTRYYERIGAGDYDAAWAMRAPAGDEAARKRFVDNFKAYERYRATVGTPTRPVDADGWQWVEAPVMIYGTYRGGKGFGTSGRVTLRRASPGRPATPDERDWHVYAR